MPVKSELLEKGSDNQKKNELMNIAAEKDFHGLGEFLINNFAISAKYYVYKYRAFLPNYQWEELIADLFIAFAKNDFRAITQFKGESDLELRAYGNTILSRMISKKCTKENKFPKLIDFLQDTDSFQDLSSLATRKQKEKHEDIIKKISDIVKNLSPQKQQLFNLLKENKTNTEIAEEMKKSKNWVYTNKNRLFEYLRTIIKIIQN